MKLGDRPRLLVLSRRVVSRPLETIECAAEENPPVNSGFF
jgi:hypothetical protein